MGSAVLYLFFLSDSVCLTQSIHPLNLQSFWTFLSFLCSAFFLSSPEAGLSSRANPGGSHGCMARLEQVHFTLKHVTRILQYPDKSPPEVTIMWQVTRTNIYTDVYLAFGSRSNSSGISDPDSLDISHLFTLVTHLFVIPLVTHQFKCPAHCHLYLP